MAPGRVVQRQQVARRHRSFNSVNKLSMQCQDSYRLGGDNLLLGDTSRYCTGRVGEITIS